MMGREISLNERDVQASLSLLKMMGLPHTRTAALLRSGGSAQWLSIRNKAMSKELTIEDLRQHFDKPIAEAAFNFGICTTLLKKICRKIGVKRWPCRQIRSLTKTIRALELQLGKTHAVDERLRLTEQIEELMEKHAAIVKDPSAGGRLGQTLRRKVLSNTKKNHQLSLMSTSSSLTSSMSSSPTSTTSSSTLTTTSLTTNIGAIAPHAPHEGDEGDNDNDNHDDEDDDHDDHDDDDDDDEEEEEGQHHHKQASVVGKGSISHAHSFASEDERRKFDQPESEPK